MVISNVPEGNGRGGCGWSLLDSVDQSTATVQSLCRRLGRALYDLGLLEIVGEDWVAAWPDGITLSSLSVRQVDFLVRRLEDISTGRPARRRYRPGPAQLRLFASAEGNYRSVPFGAIRVGQ